MPQLGPAAALQIALLLSAVPAQYYISRWCGSTAAQRYHATTRLLRIWKQWRTSYLNASAWSDWTNQQLSKVKSLVGLGQEEEQVSPPIETMIFDNDHGFFGASKAVRSPRPPFVFLRVGEVVMERKGHMIGVVVSWDEELRAPQEWVDRMYSNSEVGHKGREDATLQGAVRRTWTLFSDGCILASNTAGAPHRDEAGHSHPGELLHTF
ncbi:uncharacterized protein si:dkey-261l7.2 isoform X2 [Gambusia affinis]|uniref:uncharacterized protein si:dkey-261l7.2 isoform X2 n=1 Tax=Gambusia affinis TaxID=33528 RepID=UPI001CDD82BE|nr:uncharacterized protein si:dkey-261l7.2 isoform X2 [Gambusia affinis]